MTDRPKLTLKTNTEAAAPAAPTSKPLSKKKLRNQARTQRALKEHTEAGALVGLSAAQLRHPGPRHEHLRDLAWATLHLQRITNRADQQQQPWFGPCQHALLTLQEALKTIPKEDSVRP